ncbi:histidine kinase [Streptomyces sp. ICBB 8177]|uniref:sensor histidine kinase n=1 Tax=Streptomyces sp. ICBB 8177 TaxID=563922 RepID=UPI000D67F995|nr:histidine kinase [Streptomyces sp. ICBB 8177]PWI41241.1 sensor histidine kinase [Streptomyces sp. ICBB 8177]
MSGQAGVPLAVCALVCGGAAVLGAVLGRLAGAGEPRRQAGRSAVGCVAAAASEPLRNGLGEAAARKAVRALRPALDAVAVCLTDTHAVLAWDGPDEGRRAEVMRHVRRALDEGRTVTTAPAPAPAPGGRGRHTGTGDHRDGDAYGAVLRVVAAPLVVEGRVLGALAVHVRADAADIAPDVAEAARWCSARLELAGLDALRTRLRNAETRALRAQISPHFIFNSLAAIASFVRTDPERARELLLEFADFTRYSFRSSGDFTTLAEELHSIERYLALVRARFGDRLAVTLRIAPEVLPVALPFLCLQPLVENAVKHGVEGRADHGRVTITAADEGAQARVVIEDDGAGMDPVRLRAVLRGDGGPRTGIGLANVDERLRQTYGAAYGLVMETAPGAGMRITVRIPKYRPGVRAAPADAAAPPWPA